MPSKLTDTAREEVRLLLESDTPAKKIASALKISLSQVYRMRGNLEAFGTVAPSVGSYMVQGRPRLVNEEATQGVLEFLLEHGKQAYIDEVVIFLREEFDIEVSQETARTVIKDLAMTKKKVSIINSMPQNSAYPV
jgi:transposase